MPEPSRRRAALLAPGSLLVLGALLGAPLGAQHPPGFERIGAPGPWPPPVLRVEEPGGSVLEVEDGELSRSRDGGGTRTTLRCAQRGGTGAIHALAPGPHGSVWVAADRGVFLTSPQTDWFDAPTLRDGAPPGRPVGVLVDGRGRLWLATDRAFGVVDTRFYFGRTFGPGDGLPAPPFEGLRAGADGRILLQAAGGVFGYRPDRGPGPTGTLRAPGGGAAIRDGAIDGRSDGSAVVEVAGDAAGGATFRYRRKHHHVLYPLDSEHEIGGLKPGTHGVEVVVLDRDLNLAPVASLAVRVPFPSAFDKRTLLPVAALAGLLVVAFFGQRARRAGGGRDAFGRALVSAGLTGLIGLQVLAGFLGYGRSWPFVGFSMYTETYREGSILYKPKLCGLRRDGGQREIDMAEAGLAQDGYWQLLAEMVYGGDAPRERFLAAFNARHPREQLVGFEIRDERIRLTEDGPVEVAPIVMIRHVRG